MQRKSAQMHTPKKGMVINMEELERIRKEIDEVDREMADLFCRRMRAVERVADYKKERGLPILDEAREDAVLRRNCDRIADDELRGYYFNFQRDVMKISRAYQQKRIAGAKIAYSGTVGAFAYLAAQKLFPDGEWIAYPDFASAYRAVVEGDCDNAVLPVENSFAGEVGVVCDLLFSGPLYINRTLDLTVTQNLLAPRGATIEGIREVVSHPQALSQCATYLRDHGFAEREFANTALAAKYVAEQNDPALAAIGTEEAAREFGLSVLATGINESDRNSTRFAALSRVENKTTRQEDDRFFMVFTVKNQAGALAEAINIIGRYGFNMRGLHSRPMKTLVWQYYFYLECEGNVRSERGERMLADLSAVCDKLRIVGTYPAQ